MLDQQLVARRRRTRAARRLLRTLAVTGLMGACWPSRITIAGADNADSIEGWAALGLGVRDARVAINLGRPRANRKPVVQVVDSDGQVRAYLKVGVNDLTTELIDNEARALRFLAGARLPGVQVPTVLAHETWRGLTLLALEPVPNRSDGVGCLRDRIVQAARQIADLDRQSSAPWVASPFRSRLIAAIEAAGPRVSSLRAVIERLDSAGHRIDLGAWHGDFNPGNFAGADDRLVVWDWERFDRRVPVGFDLLHHELHEAITRRGGDPARAAADLLDNADGLLAEIGASPTAARLTAESYLAWLACRYVTDRQDVAGSRLGTVEDWLLPALDELRQV